MMGEDRSFPFFFGDSTRRYVTLLSALAIYVALIFLFLVADSMLPPHVPSFCTAEAALGAG